MLTLDVVLPSSVTDVDGITAATRKPEIGVSPGDTVGGRYVVEEVLGSGGMGVVVAARHEALGHRVAMKFVLASMSADTEAFERFSREARIIASLESDHVVRVTDFGMHAGMPYMVMDLLAGRDLGREFTLRGALPASEAVDYVIQACDGLWAAHSKAIVHRDVKLANLFLATRPDGERVVKVLDFGVSKLQSEASDDVDLTRTSTMIGSPVYMSPEQIRDPRKVDERADIWSLGVVLHRLLTGQAPFEGLTVSALCAAIAADAPTSLRSQAPHLPPGLEAVVLRCLEKSAALRYRSVAALARDLAPFASAQGKVLAGQLAAQAHDDGPLESAVHAHSSLESRSSPEQTGAASVVEARPPSPRVRRAVAWSGVAIVALATAVAVARRPTTGSLAVKPLAPVSAPVPPGVATSESPDVAPLLGTASTMTSAAPVPQPLTVPSAHDGKLAPRKRTPTAAPLPAPRSAAAPTTHFGGSALDGHN
jgi:serine/threonine protein kinase